ncbi:uncharacterized protein MONBRDRAFT_14583, partial [Monosiga brevicollis MX1]
INQALDEEDTAENLVKLLKNPSAQLNKVNPGAGEHYRDTLIAAKVYHSKLAQEAGQLESNQNLTLAQVQDAVDDANAEVETERKVAKLLESIDTALTTGGPAELLPLLQSDLLALQDVDAAGVEEYHSTLQEARNKKGEAEAGPCAWKSSQTEDGKTYYYNKDTRETSWTPPDDLSKHHLTLEEVQDQIATANAEEARWQQFVAAEPAIVQLQSAVRGMLARRAFEDRLAYLNDQEASVVKLQAALRGKRQRDAYLDRLKYLNSQVAAVVKIQAAFRGRRERKQYENLTQVDDPPVTTVRRFLHLLDQSETDFQEELNLQQLKQRVVRAIQVNTELDHNLNQMDIKIGLLVKNRISLQDVEKQNRQLKRARRRGSAKDLDAVVAHNSGGLKALTKDSRRKLEHYQNLFYLLQTQPEYLARLVFIDKPRAKWSQLRASNFLETLIELVYNYASNAREQFLLVQLYRKALKLEVEEKVTQIKDIITGNPLFIKLVVKHYRDQAGEEYVRKILNCFMGDVLGSGKQEALDLETDPLVIYRRWLTRIETETGRPADLPYDVTTEDALKHDEVKNDLDRAVRNVVALGSKIRDAFVDHLGDMPYGLRYVCRALKEDLEAKFPDASPDEVAKALGTVIYYRYFNPVMVSPERYLTSDNNMPIVVEDMQRHSLALLSRILQAAAAGQTGEGLHAGIQQFVQESWVIFNNFFIDVTRVETPEQHFNMDEYSDATLLTKPQISLSPADIFYTHEMLDQNIDRVCSGQEDHLHAILAELGSPGEEEEVLGQEDTPDRAASNVPMLLTLNNKFEVPLDDDANVRALYIRTKRMVVDVIRFQPGKNLMQILTTPATDGMEKAHKDFVDDQKKQMQEVCACACVCVCLMTLAETKAKILSNAAALETEGLCSQEDGYQGLLNAVAQDIRHQRIHRKRRKAELKRLNRTLDNLQAKHKFYEEQVEQWDQYVKNAVAHMGQGTQTKSVRRPSPHESSGQFLGTVKYTAAKLKERGVLLNVKDISETQLKFVKIEVSSDEAGIFIVRASFLGQNPFEPERIELSDLLQRQYEGMSTMKLFDDMCTVNINLLLFLINKKFYNQ